MKSLSSLANYAAANLPEGWWIEIRIESGSGTVSLFDLESGEVELCADVSLEEQVKEAVSYAREHNKNTL